MAAMARMKDKQYDLAICDPPYGIGETDHCEKHKDFKWNDKGPSKDYFNEIYRVSKNQIIWGCNYYSEFIRDPGRVIWNKLGTYIGRRLTTRSFSDCEIAAQSFNQLVKMFSFTWIGNVRGNNYLIDWNNITKIHPQQKPIELYEWLLKNYANPGDKILDTHGGSMSIAIACDIMGYDLDLYEIDKDYFEAGKARLERHQRQGKLDFTGVNHA